MKLGKALLWQMPYRALVMLNSAVLMGTATSLHLKTGLPKD